MTQSPKNTSDIDQTEKTQKSTAYVQIYKCKKRIIVQTTTGTRIEIRQTKDGPTTYYDKVEDKDFIEKIESRNGDWKALSRQNDREYDYYVLEQWDASKKPTGCFKVRKKSAEEKKLLDTKVAKQDEDWKYYVRRPENNEI